MPVCKDSLRSSLERAREARRAEESAERDFRASVVAMSNSMVLLAEQCKELSSIVKELNERVMVLENNLQQTREQIWFKPPYIEK